MRSTQQYQNILRNYLAVGDIDIVEPAPIACAKKPIANIKAVLFDVYGTILLNRLGEIGSDKKTENNSINKKNMFEKAWSSIDEYFPQLAAHRFSTELVMRIYFDTIKHQRKSMIYSGIPTPDIDIVSVWKAVLLNLMHNQQVAINKQQPSVVLPLSNSELKSLALLFEIVYNPVQLAEGIKPIMKKLQRSDMVCGIISNAQFYTPIILEYLLQQSLEGIGFESSLLFWSYSQQYAKPSRVMFERAQQRLFQKHISAHEVLYIGNDLVNDIETAQSVEFQSCLYYGDKRSINLLRYQQCTQENAPSTGIKSFDELSDVLSLR